MWCDTRYQTHIPAFRPEGRKLFINVVCAATELILFKLDIVR